VLHRFCLSSVPSYPDVIDPGEKGYYYEEAQLSISSTVDLAIVPHAKIWPARIENIRLPVSDFALSDGKYGGIRLIGRVENTYSSEQRLVRIVTILFNNDGSPIGLVSKVETSALAPGEKKGFETDSLSTKRLPADSVAGYYSIRIARKTISGI